MTEAEAWEIARLDGHAQAALVRDGQIAQDGLVEAAIIRIDQLDPAMNSVSHRAFDTARTAVRSVDRAAPMAGVPYLLKDSIDYPGMPLRSGSRARRHDMGRRVWPLAQAFDTAGLIPVGKSTMPEFGLNATAETLLNGDTRNPWDLSRSSGGSSSGAAAAVAAGLVPFAHGSDAGGSIRLPASNCGIIGFKPSRGWNLRARAHNLVDDILCSDGLYGRSVRDTAWAARTLRPGDKTSAPAPRRPLRIALDLTGFDGRTADPDVDAVVNQVAKLCADLGHVVEEARQPIDGPAMRRGFTDLWAYLGGEIVDLYSKVPGTPVEDLLEPWTLGLATKRAEVSPERLAEALAMIDQTSHALNNFYRTWDVVLSPVTRSAPPVLGHLSPSRDFDDLWVALFDYVNYTPLHNMTGATSMSLPLFMSAEGLAIGALFSARPGDDEILLALAAELETARPWANRWPPAATAQKGVAA